MPSKNKTHHRRRMPAALRRAFRRRRHGGGGVRHMFGGLVPTSLGGGKGGGVLEVAGIGVVGAVVLANLLSLPWWMSPLGAAVFIWGWWQKNNIVRALGIFLLALGLMDALGVTKAISSGVSNAMAKGGGLLGGGAKRTSAPMSSGGGGGFTSQENALLTSAVNTGISKGLDELAGSSSSSDAELSGDEFNA